MVPEYPAVNRPTFGLYGSSLGFGSQISEAVVVVVQAVRPELYHYGNKRYVYALRRLAKSNRDMYLGEPGLPMSWLVLKSIDSLNLILPGLGSPTQSKIH